MPLPDKKVFLSLLVILGITFLVYASSLKNDFVNWDDVLHLTSNGLVRSLDSEHVKNIFTTAVNFTYIPLTILSFAFEYHFFGLNPFIYHLDNVLLHLGVTALVFVFALRLKAPLAAAGMAALLFGIHPMHVESIVWVTARKDVLYGFFYMLALICYQRYLVGKNIKMYVYALISGLLSILAKPMALSLPLVLLLLDRFDGRRDIKKMLWEKVPFFIYVVPIAWITYAANKEVMVADGNFFKAVLILMWSLAFYIEKFFFPVLLVPNYTSPQPISLGNMPYGMSVAVLGLLLWCIIRHRKDRWVIFAGSFYIMTIFLILRLTDTITKGAAADRYMYMPSVGICILLGVWLDRFRKVFLKKDIFYRWIAYACCIILVGFLCAKTITQGRIWKDSVTLWTYIIGHSKVQSYFYLNRGNAYVNLKQYDLAIKDLNTALSIDPTLEEVYNDRGMIYHLLGQNTMAWQDINTALKLNPRFSSAYNSRGGLYKFQGRYDAALADYDQAVVLDPYFADAYNNRGVIYMIKGLDGPALADFNAALHWMPDFPDAYANRGLMFRLRKQYALALNDYQKALAIRPSENVYVNLGSIYNALGRYDAAVAYCSQALVLDPHSVEAYQERAMAYVGLSQHDLALSDLTQVIRLKPDDARAYFIRSVCYQHEKQYRQAYEDLLKAKSLGYHVPEIFEQELKDADRS